MCTFSPEANPERKELGALMAADHDFFQPEAEFDVSQGLEPAVIVF